MNWMYRYVGKIYVKIGGQLSSLLQGTKKKKHSLAGMKKPRKHFRALRSTWKGSLRW